MSTPPPADFPQDHPSRCRSGLSTPGSSTPADRRSCAVPTRLWTCRLVAIPGRDARAAPDRVWTRRAATTPTASAAQTVTVITVVGIQYAVPAGIG